MTYVLMTMTAIALVLTAVMYYRLRTMRRENRRLRAVVDNQHDYSFLVNDAFEVKETNMRQQGKNNEAPQILGNVLHCKNAEEAGQCGLHESCNHCPVRFVISKSFERKDNFTDVEACMELRGDGDKVRDVDVQVDGHYVSIDKEDHMVVNVKDVTNVHGDPRPKVLFVSEDVVLYNRIRELLANDYRVLNADNQRQALHRLLLATDYQFHTVITDQAFYETHEAVTKILAKNEMITVFVFTSNDEMPEDKHIRFVSRKTKDDELLKMLSA